MNRAVFGLLVGGLGLAFSMTATAPAGAQDASFGRDVWRSQANCSDCHGSMGDGNADDPRSPQGADLRETGLDEAGLIDVILCGLPGTAMPYFDHRAYTDDRCYGMTKADAGDLMPPKGAAALTRRHATGLARFILEEFVGKGPPTAEQCRSLLGPDSPRCSTLP